MASPWLRLTEKASFISKPGLCPFRQRPTPPGTFACKAIRGIILIMSAARVDFLASHDVQHVCLNGHVTNNYVSDTTRDQPFCAACGPKTITTCQDCGGLIRGGDKYGPGPMHPPPQAYRLHCGKPHPWTKSRIDAVRAIAEEAESLTAGDREALASILPDLVSRRETPQTPKWPSLR